MKKFALLVATGLFWASCGASADSPEAVAKKWCEMQTKIKAQEKGDEKIKLKQEQRDFEKSVEEKHKEDKEFMKKVEELVKACE